MLTLFLRFWLIPVAIGACARGWGACLGLVAAYMALSSLSTAIAAAGASHAIDVAATLVDGDLMILVVAIAAHGLRQAFLER